MRPNPQFLADLVPFTEEIVNGKLDLLCSGNKQQINFQRLTSDLNRMVPSKQISLLINSPY